MENVAKHLEISLQGEHLENNSLQDLEKAREVLEIAKAQDQIKKEFGYKEVRLYDQYNTIILTKNEIHERPIGAGNAEVQ